MSKFVKFIGARVEMIDETAQYTPRDPIYINRDMASGFYDHVILTNGHKIHIMETLDEIAVKLGEEDDQAR